MTSDFIILIFYIDQFGFRSWEQIPTTKMLHPRESTGHTTSDVLLRSRVPNSYFKDMYLSSDYSRVGHRGSSAAQRGNVKEEPPGRASHLYPMDVPAGLYAQAHYKGAPLKAWSGE